MELLSLLMFLTGWFVCWIQMSKSESRALEQQKSEYQELESKFQGLSQRYVSLDQELKRSQYQLGQSEYQRLALQAQLEPSESLPEKVQSAWD